MNSFEKDYYESETFWQGDMLHDLANQQRISVTSMLIPNDVKSIADIGCGNGIFVNYLFEHKPTLKITGVDRSASALQYVKTEKIEADIANLPFSDKSIDCVSCLEVIEHLPVPIYDQSLKELARVSAKYIILSVPFEEILEESYNRCPSCKTIFNYELHVRQFNEQTFTQLFSKYGFECIKHQKLNPTKKFIWHKQYRKLFYPEQFLAWHSPICPVCGYKDSKKVDFNNSKPEIHINTKKKILTFFSSLPKMLWPKETRYYWILGLFERKEN